MSRRVVSPIACIALFASAVGAADEADTRLRVHGPGAVFASVEAAAVDALAYGYLQARKARDLGRMRAGTIQRVDEGFSYGEIRVAGPLLPGRITYALGPRDVARFQIYPRLGDRDANRIARRASKADRRSVRFADPLHRPLYILHPSLVIRVCRGEEAECIDVAGLRRLEQGLLIAGSM
jgi:hypothetical protein